MATHTLCLAPLHVCQEGGYQVNFDHRSQYVVLWYCPDCGDYYRIEISALRGDEEGAHEQQPSLEKR